MMGMCSSLTLFHYTTQKSCRLCKQKKLKTRKKLLSQSDRVKKWPEFKASEKKDLIILVALTAHHTPTLTSCNGTSWINMGNLLVGGFIYPSLTAKTTMGNT